METYTNVRGLEGFAINCVYEGTTQNDENLISDVAKLIVNSLRKVGETK